ncbi:MAG: hypothetical protein KME64_03270 [Scytonematopsis contorta HA4267-MV1]|jgi:hypothetical protein|nr:hypothetical protein [Scytonematopsis contorta HA4267-MV1]
MNLTNIKQIELTSGGWRLNIISPRLATITDPYGNRKTTYFGFDTQDKAEIFKNWLIKHNKCSKAIVRSTNQRLTTQWEVKAWGISTELINKCATKESNQSSKSSNAIISV